MAAHTELKRGSAELMVLAAIEERARHGYEMEKRGWIDGAWVEKAGQRRRRYYRLTVDGRKILASQRSDWHALLTALHRVAGLDPL
jgi:DNA-binding PadR family transcriptional regulator